MASTDANQPRSVGRYELLFRIASGGMAEVYAGRVSGEAGFQKLVAVKRMLPQLADDEEFTTMFLDEARVAANISSPNCVSTIDLGRADDGSLFIVMELVVGVTLARILKWSVTHRQPIPTTVAIDLLAQAAHGLHDAHEATTPLGHPLQIVHRDVSPQNVLVGIDGRVRLTDFGVARAVARMTETVTGRVKGKFAYMAPEQLTAKEIDRRADVFSLGIVAWELFTGQRLFIGEHPAETMDRVRNMPILAVEEVRADVPKEVSDVVSWALQRDIERRCPSAREFEDALRAAAHHARVPMVREDVVRYVKASGGDALGKIRENIKLALSMREGLSEPIELPEVNLTPSGIQSAVKSFPRADSADPTDPTTGSAEARLHPDASAPSAVAGPGSVLSAFDMPAQQPPRRTGARLGLFAAVVVLIGLGIGSYVILSAPGEDESVAIPITPAVGAPAEPPIGDPPVTDVVEEEPAEAVEQAAVPEVAIVPEEETVAEPATSATAMRRRTDRRRASMRTEETVAVAEMVATPPPDMEATTMTTTSPTMMGLVGIDAFDRGLDDNRPR